MTRHVVVAGLLVAALASGCGDDGARQQAQALASQAALDRASAEAAASRAARDRAAAEAVAEEAARERAAGAQDEAAAAAAERAAEQAATVQAVADQAVADRAVADRAVADRAAAEQAAARRAAASAGRVDPRPRGGTAHGVAATAGRNQPSDGSFDRAYALRKAADITEDIATVDERLLDGIMVGSALALLSASYGRLEAAGVPPGVDEAQYVARLRTLASFASTAADEMSHAPIDGSARFAVLRRETGVLFEQVNAALGTSLRLPSAP